MFETVPDSYIEIDETVATNYDHSIDETVVKRLKKENIWAPYVAWDFSGTVWFDKEENIFKCMIECYRGHVETIKADTIERIMEIASEKYGHQ